MYCPHPLFAISQSLESLTRIIAFLVPAKREIIWLGPEACGESVDKENGVPNHGRLRIDGLSHVPGWQNDEFMSVAISLVVPVYNEEESLPLLWGRLCPILARLDRSWELILVDDGSTDRSLECMQTIRTDDPRIRIVVLDRNYGQSAAMDAGFHAARGAWIITLDADLQNPPEEIPRLLEASNGVDLVYGWRARRHDSWTTRLSSRIGNGTRNLITGHHVHDTGCTLKCYRREALELIPLFRGMHRFLPTLFKFHGFAIREIKVAHESRVAGTSKYGIGNRAWRGFLDCLAVRWMRTRAFDYKSTELENNDGVV
jgi:dolichol-phosphate mannosyltransferase